VAQRFTAAMSGWFSVLALAAGDECGEHKEFFSSLFSRCGKTQTSPRTEKIVILSAAGTSRSEVSAESKDPYPVSRPQGASGNSPRAAPLYRVLKNSILT
jgi:hypothetical protein